MTIQLFRLSTIIRPDVASENDKRNTHILQRIETKLLWILTLLLALGGILLRIEKAILDRSFRGDEAALASAIKNHSLFELITIPLGGSVTAPLGFLASEKLVVSLLGTEDFYFRFVPLLAGCLSVILVFILAKILLNDFGAAFTAGAFSLNWML